MVANEIRKLLIQAEADCAVVNDHLSKLKRDKNLQYEHVQLVTIQAELVHLRKRIDGKLG